MRIGEQGQHDGADGDWYSGARRHAPDEQSARRQPIDGLIPLEASEEQGERQPAGKPETAKHRKRVPFERPEPHPTHWPTQRDVHRQPDKTP